MHPVLLRKSDHGDTDPVQFLYGCFSTWLIYTITDFENDIAIVLCSNMTWQDIYRQALAVQLKDAEVSNHSAEYVDAV